MGPKKFLQTGIGPFPPLARALLWAEATPSHVFIALVGPGPSRNLPALKNVGERAPLGVSLSSGPRKMVFPFGFTLKPSHPLGVRIQLPGMDQYVGSEFRNFKPIKTHFGEPISGIMFVFLETPGCLGRRSLYVQEIGPLKRLLLPFLVPPENKKKDVPRNKKKTFPPINESPPKQARYISFSGGKPRPKPSDPASVLVRRGCGSSCHLDLKMEVARYADS